MPGQTAQHDAKYQLNCCPLPAAFDREPAMRHTLQRAHRPPPAPAQGDATLSLELNDATLRDPKSLKGVALVAEKPLGCEWAGAEAGAGAGGAVQSCRSCTEQQVAGPRLVARAGRPWHGLDDPGTGWAALARAGRPSPCMHTPLPLHAAGVKGELRVVPATKVRMVEAGVC